MQFGPCTKNATCNPETRIDPGYPEPRVEYSWRRRTWITADRVDVVIPSISLGFQIPMGWEFDMASVPRLFWRLIAPHDLSITAPLIHDWIYTWRGQCPEESIVPYRIFTRLDADTLFRDIMILEGVAGWRCRSAHLAVRTFGGYHWRA